MVAAQHEHSFVQPAALGSRANQGGKLIGSLTGVTAELVDLARGGLDQEERAISKGLPHARINHIRMGRANGIHASLSDCQLRRFISAAGGWRGRALIPQLSSLGQCISSWNRKRKLHCQLPLVGLR